MSRRSLIAGLSALAGSARGEDRRGRKVFLDYTQAELDHALDQAAHAPNWRELVGVYEALSAAARERLRPQEEAYGDGPEAKMDVYRARVPRAPLILMLHGGGWRMMGRRDVAYAAQTFLDGGVAYAAPSYGLRPARTLLQMAQRCREAVIWAHNQADHLDVDPERIFVGGLSAGAHLAGVLMATDWLAYGLPRRAVAGGVLVSGIFDARALAASTVYGYVDLEAEAARALSPILHVSRIRSPALVAWGEREPPEFARQSRAFSEALRRRGKAHEALIAPGKTHFEIGLELADPASDLSRAALRLIERG